MDRKHTMKDTETRTRAAAKKSDEPEGMLLRLPIHSFLIMRSRCSSSCRFMGEQKHCSAHDYCY